MGCKPSKSDNIVVASNLSPQPRPQPKPQPEVNNNLVKTKPGVPLSDKVEKQQKQSKDPEQGDAVKAVEEQAVYLSFEKACQLKPEDPEEMWAIVKKTCDSDGIELKPTKNRRGWRTVRIFVSSTFKDFHQEREVLVKEVRLTMLSHI